MPRQQFTFKQVKIVLEPFGKDNDNKPFASIDLDVMSLVMNDLSASEFKLWTYLCANKKDYILHYNVEHTKKFTGMSRSTIYDQWNNLMAKGYIVESLNETFIFYQLPQRLKDVRELDT